MVNTKQQTDMTPKRITYLVAALVALGAAVSCEHNDVYEEVDFSVRLAAGNTYRAGEPVVFEFGGNADFITVWNGDTGHEYRYRDRTTVDLEDIEKCELTLEIGQQWGPTDLTSNLDLVVSNRFAGLDGADAAKDRPVVEALDRSDWQTLDYTVEKRTSTVKWQTRTYDVTALADNFSWAMYLHAPADEAMRFYFVNPSLTVQFKQYEPQTYSYSAMDFVSFSLAARHASNPYIHNASGNGNPKFQGQGGATVDTGQITFQGGNANQLGEVAQWVFMQPIRLNTIASDTGENIKGVTDDIPSYEHTYDRPGTYTATFIVSKGNYQGQSRVVREVTFTVVESIR